MDALELHLNFNYFPAIGMMIGTAALLLGFWLKSDKVKRASLWILFITALVTMPVFVSGEIAGSGGGMYSGAFADVLRQHKEAARPAFVVMEAAGIAALAGLILFRRRSTRTRSSVIFVLVLATASCGLIIRTTYIGRQIKLAGASIGSDSHTNELNQIR